MLLCGPDSGDWCSVLWTVVPSVLLLQFECGFEMVRLVDVLLYGSVSVVSAEFVLMLRSPWSSAVCVCSKWLWFGDDVWCGGQRCAVNVCWV